MNWERVGTGIQATLRMDNDMNLPLKFDIIYLFWILFTRLHKKKTLLFDGNHICKWMVLSIRKNCERRAVNLNNQKGNFTNDRYSQDNRSKYKSGM